MRLAARFVSAINSMSRKPVKPGQIEIPIQREREPDRHHAQGGRSFYFFDFDDNIAHIGTPTLVFHKETQAELQIPSHEYVLHQHQIGRSGKYADYEVSYCESDGSFRFFRDHGESEEIADQHFVADIKATVQRPNYTWQGPSWPCFYHAVFNHRPLALITARGHHPETLKKGIIEFVENGLIPNEPNYLALFPVSNQQVQKDLGMVGEKDIALLKRAAIRKSVEKAFKVYGQSPYHRFGMSDDDPRNLDLILKAMRELKSTYCENSFFVISTHGGEHVKTEVFHDHTEESKFDSFDQLSLLDDDSGQKNSP